MTHIRKTSAMFGLATLAALGLAAVQPAHAQLANFAGGAGSGANQYTLNQGNTGTGPSISGGTLQLTTAANNEGNSAWYNTIQNAGGFTAKFTYTPAATAVADGATFTLQNNGLNGVGIGGNLLGYGGTNSNTAFAPLTHSVAVALNFYGSGNDVNTGLPINNGTIALSYGVGGTLQLSNYMNTGMTVSGGPIDVSLVSNGQQVLATLKQGTTTFSNTFNLDVPLALAGNTAYAGFTGSTGGLNADQQISNFTYTSTTPVANYVNITSPTDTISAVDGTGTVPTTGDSPAAQGVAKVIDRDSNTKYLNFTGTNSGFVITPGKGSTVVTALELTSANDTPGRDPATFTFLGKNAGDTTFTQIAAGTVPVFAGRFQSQILTFANTTAYTSYELLFPTLVGAYPTSVNSMQIAEVGLLAAAPEPGEIAGMLMGGLSLLGLIARKRRMNV